MTISGEGELDGFALPPLSVLFSNRRRVARLFPPTHVAQNVNTGMVAVLDGIAAAMHLIHPIDQAVLVQILSLDKGLFAARALLGVVFLGTKFCIEMHSLVQPKWVAEANWLPVEVVMLTG